MQLRDSKIQYTCSNCDNILKETPIQVDILTIGEECDHCGALLSQSIYKKYTLEKYKAIVKYKGNFRNAFNCKLNIDIKSINSIIGHLSIGEKICITDKYKDFAKNFVSRFSAMVMKSILYPTIFVDAGNKLDLYKCIYYARQYGIDICKFIDNITISRSFTPYQLTNTIVCEVPKIIEKINSKVLIINDFFEPFYKINLQEGKSLLKQIIQALEKIASNDVLILISFSSYVRTEYDKIISKIFDKKIECTDYDVQQHYYTLNLSNSLKKYNLLKMPKRHLILIN